MLIMYFSKEKKWKILILDGKLLTFPLLSYYKDLKNDILWKYAF